jgi:monoamine oxidase
MASHLQYSPPLPRALRRALDAWQSGAVIKILIRYRTAFWRERGLSGMVAWRDPPSLFCLDTSKDKKHASLTFFAGGPRALEWRRLGEAAMRAEVTGRLAAALGPEAAEPLDVSIRDWTDDRWSGGAYSDLIVDMNATDAEDVLLAGAPPVFFAASELSPSFPGYIEGAIVAGKAAAQRIICYLK